MLEGSRRALTSLVRHLTKVEVVKMREEAEVVEEHMVPVTPQSIKGQKEAVENHINLKDEVAIEAAKKVKR